MKDRDRELIIALHFLSAALYVVAAFLWVWGAAYGDYRWAGLATAFATLPMAFSAYLEGRSR